MTKELEATARFLRGFCKYQAGILTKWDDGQRYFFPVEHDAVQEIENILARMPERWAETLRLLFIMDVSEKDVAQVLGVSRSHVKNLRHLGLTRFRELWMKHYAT